MQLASIHHINRRTKSIPPVIPDKLTVPNQSEFLHNSSRNLFSHVFFFSFSSSSSIYCWLHRTQCMTTSSTIVSAKNCHSTKCTYFMFSCILLLSCAGPRRMMQLECVFAAKVAIPFTRWRCITISLLLLYVFLVFLFYFHFRCCHCSSIEMGQQSICVKFKLK